MSLIALRNWGALFDVGNFVCVLDQFFNVCVIGMSLKVHKNTRVSN